MKIKIGDVIAKCVFNGHWQNEPVAVKRMKLLSDTIISNHKQLMVPLHPNVVSLRCQEDVEEFRYYAMQLCKSTLEKSLSENCDCYMGPLPVPEDILCQLADGLEYLHEKKLFHGNLKPSNALVYINPTGKGKEAIMKWSLPGLSTTPLKEKKIYAMGFGDLETSELSFDELLLADVFAEGVTFAYFLSEGKYQLGSKPSQPDNVAVINKIPSAEARTLILKMLSENLKDRISSSDVAEELRRIKEKLGEDLMVLRDDSSTITSIKQFNSFLGKGGYSVGVYEGVWRRKRVAIKQILATEDLIINREEVLRKLEHPNVIPLYAILKDEFFRYFVMELCVASLDKLFKNEKGYNGPKLEDMPPPEDVFLQLAEGMSYIHKLNLSHRDIKPHNVLIYVKQEKSNDTSNNVDVILKWTDFGGSKKVNTEGNCSMSDFKFTYNWCSPEVIKQFFYETTDASKFNQKMIKSDIFSEGLVFAFYLLEGKHLYGSSNDEIQRNLTDNNPINMPTIEEKHKQLSIVIKTMLETKPNLRPSSQEVTEQIASIKSLKEKAPVNPSKTQFDSNAIIGKGRNSTVYLGKFGPEGFQVAVKKKKNPRKPEITFNETEEEKKREKLILNLKHENIVQLYDVQLYDVNDHERYRYTNRLFTMEYCIASMDHIFLPPEDRQKYNGPLPNRGEVLIQLASGLEYIHSSGFSHGNIKPQSVLIANTNNKITMKWGNLKIWQTLKLGYDLSSQKFEIEFQLETSRRELLEELKEIKKLEEMEKPEEKNRFRKELENLKKWKLLRRREFHLREKLEELELEEREDLYKAGHIFRYYLSSGNLEREPFDELKVTTSIKCLNQLILEMENARRVSSSEVVKRLQLMKKEMDNKFANLLTTNPPNLEEIKSMVEGIVDINRVDENGYTPLLRFIQMSNGDYLLEVISLLLEHGADVNHKDEDGWNALYFLCHYHQQKDDLIEIVKLLIKYDIDVKWKPKDENNVLHYYCKNYKGEPLIDIVEIFLKKGVEMVFDGVDARNLVNNPKYLTRKNAKEIIDLMNNIVL